MLKDRILAEIFAAKDQHIIAGFLVDKFSDPALTIGIAIGQMMSDNIIQIEHGVISITPKYVIDTSKLDVNAKSILHYLCNNDKYPFRNSSVEMGIAIGQLQALDIVEIHSNKTISLKPDWQNACRTYGV